MLVGEAVGVQVSPEFVEMYTGMAGRLKLKPSAVAANIVPSAEEATDDQGSMGAVV